MLADIHEAYPDIPRQGSDDLMALLIRIASSTGERFIFIIDEWDAICREFPASSSAIDQYVNWLRRMFKGGNTAQVFAGVYMTGILPVKKYETESALNNFWEYSMVEPMEMAPFFGFKKEEMRRLAEKYGATSSSWASTTTVRPRPMSAAYRNGRNRLRREQRFAKVRSIHHQHTEGAGGGGAVSCESLAVFAIGDEPVVVHIIFAMAFGAGGDAVGGHGEWRASHRYGIRVEAVGTFPVICVEGGGDVEGAITHDDAVVVTEDECAPRIHGILYRTAAHPRVVDEVVIGGSAAHRHRHLTEDARCGRVHRTGQGGVVMYRIVVDEIASLHGVFVLGVPAGCEGEKDGEKREYAVG